MMIGKSLRGLPRKLAASRHNSRIRGILQTAPARRSAEGPVYLGMTCHRDALAWLVAVKSIARHVGPGDYVAVDDGSLTEDDKALLSQHLPGLRIRAMRAVDTHGCPHGGMWERLMVVLELAATRYVVQVDSDLVALGPIDEVADAVRRGVGFTLSGEPGVAVQSLADAAAAAAQQTYPHIQHDTERALAAFAAAAEAIGPGEALRYVRGCAGFTGFPPGDWMGLALAFSGFMQARFGRRWESWGTEQITSNFVVANTGALAVLPWPSYPAFTGETAVIEGARLVHFIGTARFQAGAYTKASLAAIATLAAADPKFP